VAVNRVVVIVHDGGLEQIQAYKVAANIAVGKQLGDGSFGRADVESQSVS
jgi:hypothetical protein